MQKFVTSADPIILLTPPTHTHTQRNPHQTDSSLRGNYSSEGLTREPRFYGNGIGPLKNTWRCARGIHGGQAPATPPGDAVPRLQGSRAQPCSSAGSARGLGAPSPSLPRQAPQLLPGAGRAWSRLLQPCGAISTGNWFWCSLVFILSGVGDALNDVKETVKWVSFRFLGSFWR